MASMAPQSRTAAPQNENRSHVLQNTSPQQSHPSKSQIRRDPGAVKRQVAEQAYRQLQCIEALLILSQSKCPGLDLSTLLPPSPKAVSPNKSILCIDSHTHSEVPFPSVPMQPFTGLVVSDMHHPASTARASASGLEPRDHDTWAHDGRGSSCGRYPALWPTPAKQGASCGPMHASAHQSLPPSHAADAKTPASQTPRSGETTPEQSLAMGLRKERKRKVLHLLDEDPEWAVEVLRRQIRNEGTNMSANPAPKSPARGKSPPGGLSADLQNASQHMDQRRGVYFKLKEKAFEAQLDTARYKKNLKVEMASPNVWYLGLFRVEPATVEQLHTAQDRATRTVDRARVKLLEDVLAAKELQKELHFPLSDYQTETEIKERKSRNMKDYCNFLKHNADARRAQHGGKGVAARRRTNGTISYEARISKHNVGTFGTYASLEDAKYAYDVGAIICKGTDYRLNYPVSKYMTDARFLAHVLVPEPLKTIIQNHLNGLPESESTTWLKRVEAYFEDGKCPFYKPPAAQYSTLSPAQGWAKVVQAAQAEKASISVRNNTSARVPIVPDVLCQDNTASAQLSPAPGVAGAVPTAAPIMAPTAAPSAAPSAAPTAATTAATKETHTTPIGSDRMAALLAGTAMDMPLT